MFCNKCGKENPDGAAYCKKCGSPLEAEEETRLSSRPSDTAPEKQPPGDERRIFSINPTLKFVFVGYALAVFAAFALVILLTVFVPGFVPLLGVAVGLIVLLVPVYYHVRQKLVRYSLTDATLEIDRGLISRTTQNIPLRRIQDVTVSASLFQRMLGYGDVTIDNASEDGGKVVLDNVDSPKRYAELILRQMREIER